MHVCGKEQVLIVDVTMPKQFIAPAFPTEYSSTTLYCDYVVVAQENTRIRFWINDFGTEIFGSSFYLWVCFIFLTNLHCIFQIFMNFDEDEHSNCLKLFETFYITNKKINKNYYYFIARFYLNLSNSTVITKQSSTN